ncbi:hypothetical protein DPMN_055715 [Dreissena polymorpha]|uniref:Carboxylesterase type B domain-containing protein n=1 Tax=Dreissena polymorpha TaxID=45954 RepID=A0A9D4CR91_DREPO|nr:hypothetical protein DPMN_055715 [Dreissena polymorpha]
MLVLVANGAYCITVQTPVGAISGLAETLTVDGRQYRMSKFLSIPFAESTAGENRFMKPIPKAPFRARSMRLSCPWRVIHHIMRLNRS